MKKKITKRRTQTALVPRIDLRGSGAVSRLVQVVLDVDLRAGHDGLLALGKKKGVDWNKLNPGQYVAFVNRQLNRFMLLGISPSRRGAVIIYYKSYAGRIDRQEMESLPLAFGSENRPLMIDTKTSEKLDEGFKFKRARRVGPEVKGKIGG